jgi:hypothetical protein
MAHEHLNRRRPEAIDPAIASSNPLWNEAAARISGSASEEMHGGQPVGLLDQAPTIEPSGDLAKAITPKNTNNASEVCHDVNLPR